MSRIGALTLCSLAIAPTWAQEAQAPASDPGKSEGIPKAQQLETVTVTASKRKEDVRKVPLSVTVIGGEELEDQHITSITDLTRSVPNLSFSGGAAGGGSGLSTIELRGISSQAGSATVGIYLDDVSMTTRNLYSLGGAEPKFFDIDRIEVLRGPQGTLYGASSMGGTIRFISNQPNATLTESSFSGEVSSTKGGGVTSIVSGVYNTPLIQNELALRMGVQVGKIGGYIDQLSQTTGGQIAKDINSEHDLVLKLAMKWMPSARLSVTPSIFYQKVKSDGLDVSHLTDFNGNELAPNKTDQLLREPGTDKLLVPSVTVAWDAGFADVTSVTSYFKRTFSRQQDGQAANSEFFGCCLIAADPPGLAAAVNNLPSAVLLDNSVHQFSQELRLASKAYDPKGGSPFVWLTGLYFSNLKTKVTDNEPVYGMNATFAQFGASTADPNVLTGAFPGDFPNDNAYFSERRYQEKQSAIFGELVYYLNPALRFTAGARYLHAKETLDRDGDFYFAAGKQYSSFSGTYHAFTPKFAVNWDIDPVNTVFASATKGFRLGGANRAIPLSLCGDELSSVYNINASPGTFESDSLWSYEIGNKSRFFDNRLSLNASFFYVKWKDIQQDIQLACTFDFEGNFGKATSKGIELEARARVTQDLTMSLFGGTTRATFDGPVASLNVSSGDQLQGVPKWNGAISGDYRFFTNSSVSGFFRSALRWVGSSRGSFDRNNADYARPSYKTLDASIGANYQNWEVSLFVKNLTNDQTILQRPYVQFLTEAYRQRPRTIGIFVSKKL